MGAREWLVCSVCAFLVTIVSGCSSHVVGLTYEAPERQVQRAGRAVAARIAPFSDRRGTAENWLGAIRGGFGNPLKRLVAKSPIADLVSVAFRDALIARGMIDEAGDSKFELTGVITKLDCSYYMRKEAHAHLTVQVRRVPSMEVIFTKQYAADLVEAGVGAGIFGSVDGLRELAERAMRKAIDEAVDDSAFRQSLEPSLPVGRPGE